jgi:hypothetical protein
VTTRRWLTRRNITVLGLATAGFLAAVAGPASAAHAADVPPPALELAHDFQIQENGYYCGPSATRVALSAQGKVLTQDQVAQKLGTTPNGTDSINQVTDALNGELGAGRYHSVTIPGPKASPEQVAQLKADVVTSLSAGKPIVANIAGTVTDEDGQVHAYQGGHYLPSSATPATATPSASPTPGTRTATRTTPSPSTSSPTGPPPAATPPDPPSTTAPRGRPPTTRGALPFAPIMSWPS